MTLKNLKKIIIFAVIYYFLINIYFLLITEFYLFQLNEVDFKIHVLITEKTFISNEIVILSEEIINRSFYLDYIGVFFPSLLVIIASKPLVEGLYFLYDPKYYLVIPFSVLASFNLIFLSNLKLSRRSAILTFFNINELKIKADDLENLKNNLNIINSNIFSLENLSNDIFLSYNEIIGLTGYPHLTVLQKLLFGILYL